MRLDEKKRPHKHIQVACSKDMKGPWTVHKEPILTPDSEFLDGLHCYTPTAYWFAEKGKAMIVYKGYPSKPQIDQPYSAFGSSTVTAWWHPKNLRAQKSNPVLRPGQTDYWNKGWISSCQIMYDAKDASWYGIINASPIPPEDESHWEPAPSLADG